MAQITSPSKQKGLGIHQVPITTKPLLPKYYIDSQLLAVTLIVKEESPYKPDQPLINPFLIK